MIKFKIFTTSNDENRAIFLIIKASILKICLNESESLPIPLNDNYIILVIKF